MKEGKKYLNCLLLSVTCELNLTLFEQDELSKWVEMKCTTRRKWMRVCMRVCTQKALR